MSITESASVHSTRITSPGRRGPSALRTRNAGRGHFKPRRSSVVSVILVRSTHLPSVARRAVRVDDVQPPGIGGELTSYTVEREER